MVLHVEGHGRAGRARRLADRPGVVEGHLLAVAGSAWPTAESFTRHLGARGQPLAGEAPRRVQVGVDVAVACGGVERVLAEVVERDDAALGR